jgi:hypothetical protein
MATQKTIFETDDGRQFYNLHDAEQYEFRRDLAQAIDAGWCGSEFNTDDAIAALLAAFEVERK